MQHLVVLMLLFCSLTRAEESIQSMFDDKNEDSLDNESSSSSKYLRRPNLSRPDINQDKKEAETEEEEGYDLTNNYSDEASSTPGTLIRVYQIFFDYDIQSFMSSLMNMMTLTMILPPEQLNTNSFVTNSYAYDDDEETELELEDGGDEDENEDEEDRFTSSTGIFTPQLFNPFFSLF